MNNSIEEEGLAYSRDGRISRGSYQEREFLISREESIDEYSTTPSHRVMLVGGPGVGKTLLIEKFLSADSHESEKGKTKLK